MDSRDEGSAERNEIFRERGRRLLLLLRQRVQRGLPEERGPVGRHPAGQAPERGGLGHVLRRAAGRCQVSELRPRLDAMRSSRPSRTRTARRAAAGPVPEPGRLPAVPAVRRLRGLPAAFVAAAAAPRRALGEGAEAWNAAMASFQNPVYIAFHVVAFLALVLVHAALLPALPEDAAAEHRAGAAPAGRLLRGGAERRVRGGDGRPLAAALGDPVMRA